MSDTIPKFTLALNLESLKQSCLTLKDQIPDLYTTEDADKSYITAYLMKYNIFEQDYTDDLLSGIQEHFREIESEGTYYIHGWLNVYTQAHPNVAYHSHAGTYEGNYHGVFIVCSPEDKYTHYRFNDGTEQTIYSIPNTLFFCRSGESEHATSPVENDELRITIAFDIITQQTYDRLLEMGTNNTGGDYIWDSNNWTLLV